MRVKREDTTFIHDFYDSILYRRCVSIKEEQALNKVLVYIIETLGKTGKKRINILDIGIGPGILAIPLVKHKSVVDIKIFGVDKSSNMLGLLEKNINKEGLQDRIKYHQMDFIKDDIKRLAGTDKFDAIICSRVSGAFSKFWRQFYSKAFNLLDSGGILFLAHPISDYACLDGNFCFLEEEAYKSKKRSRFIEFCFELRQILESEGYVKWFPVQATNTGLALTYLRLKEGAEKLSSFEVTWNEKWTHDRLVKTFLSWITTPPLNVTLKEMNKIRERIASEMHEFGNENFEFIHGLRVHALMKCD